MSKYTLGGLFVGIGGIELGFSNTGSFKISWANEIDKNACQTYRANFGHDLIEDDIHKIDASTLSPVDVLAGGFPCQAFSVAGYRKGFSDPRGNLFFEIVRFIEELPEKPKALFLENVKNFYTHDKGNTFKIVKRTLENLGYSVFTKILNTATYTDIPQNRERTFIICFRDEVDWSLKPDDICSWTFSKLFPPEKSNNRKHIKELLTNERVEDKYYYTDKNYMYDDLKETVKSRDTVYQWRRVYVRENKKDMCPTLTANMGTGGHNVPLILDGYGIRKLTPRECFRFQGFPNSYILPTNVASSQLYKQAGNAVTVSLIQKLAEGVLTALNAKY